MRGKGMNCQELAALLDDLFMPSQFSDGCHNGLVIPTPEPVHRLLVAVSINRALIEKALSLKANAILVHHGVFQSGNWHIPQTIFPMVHTLIRHGIALFAYHLPMDAHVEFSHNRHLIQLLSDSEPSAFAPYGLIVDLPQRMTLDQLLQKLPVQEWAVAKQRVALDLATAMEWDRGRWVCRSGVQEIGRVAVVSGRGASELPEAAAAGAELFITGEISEHHPELAAQLGINLVALGHYLSETGGLMRLGEWLKKVTALEVIPFLEVNPL